MSYAIDLNPNYLKVALSGGKSWATKGRLTIRLDGTDILFFVRRKLADKIASDDIATINSSSVTGNTALQNMALLLAAMQSSGSPYTAEYQAILDFATAQGYALPSAATQTAHNTFVASLKSANLWGELDLLNIYYGDMTQDFARINWVNPVVGALATLVNAPTYTNKRGFNSNGTTSYIATEFDPTTGVSFLLNDACAGFFGYNDADSGRLFGSSDSKIIVSCKTAGQSRVAMNSNSSFLTAATNAGLIAGVRTTSTRVFIYQNASVVDTDNANSSTTAPSHLHVLAAGAGFAPNTFQVQAAFAGSSALYSDGGTAMSSAFNTLMSTSL